MAIIGRNTRYNNNIHNNKADHGIAVAPLDEFMPPSPEAWLNAKPTTSVCNGGKGPTLPMTGRRPLLPSNMASLTGIVAAIVCN